MIITLAAPAAAVVPLDCADPDRVRCRALQQEVLRRLPADAPEDLVVLRTPGGFPVTKRDLQRLVLRRLEDQLEQLLPSHWWRRRRTRGRRHHPHPTKKARAAG